MGSPDCEVVVVPRQSKTYVVVPTKMKVKDTTTSVGAHLGYYVRLCQGSESIGIIALMLRL